MLALNFRNGPGQSSNLPCTAAPLLTLTFASIHLFTSLNAIRVHCFESSSDKSQEMSVISNSEEHCSSYGCKARCEDSCSSRGSGDILSPISRGTLAPKPSRLSLTSSICNSAGLYLLEAAGDVRDPLAQ